MTVSAAPVQRERDHRHGTQLIVAGDVVGDSGASFDFTLEASPFNFPAGATVEQSFTIFGGTGTCNSLLCWNEGNNTLISNEACDNGETFQFISDDNANTYAILVAAGSGSRWWSVRPERLL